MVTWDDKVTNLAQVLDNWDGKSVGDIGSIFERYQAEPGFSAEILRLLEQGARQKGASWLLKRYLETGAKLELSKVELAYQALPKLEHWESKLHLLQSISYMPISKASKKTVERFLRECLTDDNKFIRAWSYSGFYELSLQYPQYREETESFFRMAMRDEAASVKARIRNLRKRTGADYTD